MGMESNLGFVGNRIQKGMVERRYPVIIEFGCNGSKHRHFVRGDVPCSPVALNLFAHIPDSVLSAAFFIFVNDHDIGVIQHVDFFKLGGCAELAGHDIHGGVHDIGDQRIALADAGGFGDDQIKAGSLQGLDGFAQGIGDFGVGLSGGQRPHVHAGASDGVHADSVAKQRAAGFSPGWIATDDGDMNLRDIMKETQNQLIGQ